MDENEPDKPIHEVEDQLQPEKSPATPPTQPSEGLPWAAIFLGLWAVLLIIFSVQNAEQTPVHFLGWTIDMPVALLVMVTALVTLVLTGLGSFFYRRRRRKRAELKLRAQSADQPPQQ
jgi:uncharacterized integral membrane protein